VDDFGNAQQLPEKRLSVLSIKKPIFNKIQVRKAAKMWRDTPGRGGLRPSLSYDVKSMES